MIKTKVTASAGGIVLNRQNLVLVINQNSNSWSLPKGHVEAGETPQEAAIREIEEESGLTQLKLIKILGVYGRYKLGKNTRDDKSEWKLLTFFLFKTRQTRLNPQDPRHPEARWVRLDEVPKFLTHPKDKAFFKSIRSQISHGTA
ncbi:MAG: NUDIX hydrolase [Candidatus Omnitrophica bacterium]|nr:NUDIX hydrolase [Candidatus Omnitrophota bacterium]MDE2223500.1 NUDIX hydrolase [Candidatus Omnitrophota bacterium]